MVDVRKTTEYVAEGVDPLEGLEVAHVFGDDERPGRREVVATLSLLDPVALDELAQVALDAPPGEVQRRRQLRRRPGTIGEVRQQSSPIGRIGEEARGVVRHRTPGRPVSL